MDIWGRTHPFLIVLKYKVADFFSPWCSQTLIQLEGGEGGGRREKISLVREEYEMEREEKYCFKKKKNSTKECGGG